MEDPALGETATDPSQRAVRDAVTAVDQNAVEGPIAMARVAMAPSDRQDRIAMVHAGMVKVAMAPGETARVAMARVAMARVAMTLAAMTVRSVAPSGFRRRRRRSSPRPVGLVAERRSSRVRARIF